MANCDICRDLQPARFDSLIANIIVNRSILLDALWTYVEMQAVICLIIQDT